MADRGRNVWFDLMTPDVEGAKAFYGEVIGWKTQPYADAPADKPYTMWLVGELPIGGVMTLPEEAAKMGAPPHWMAYTTVEDTDAAAKKVTELGGKIYKEPWDIPNVGRVAIVADPQGAVFAIFKPTGEMKVGGDAVGEIGWSELNTTDYESAWKFYSELFGWKHKSSFDMGPDGTYFMWHDATEGTRGGMSNVAKKMNIPPHWLYYVTVEDIDATVERVKNSGGKIMNGPMEVPGGDKIAQCADPQGAHFAIYAENKK